MLSRVADTLFWMSSYLERAEHTARLLDLQLHQMLEQEAEESNPRWERILASVHATPPPGLDADAYSLTHLLTFDTANSNAIMSCMSASRSARKCGSRSIACRSR